MTSFLSIPREITNTSQILFPANCLIVSELFFIFKIEIAHLLWLLASDLFN